MTARYIIILIIGIITFILNAIFFRFKYPDIPLNYVITILGLIAIGNIFRVIPQRSDNEIKYGNEIVAAILISIIRGLLFIILISDYVMTVIYIIPDITISIMIGRHYFIKNKEFRDKRK